MTFRLIIRPEAEADIEESFLWYEDQAGGLGHEFRAELRRALARIKSTPMSFPKIYRDVRRVLVSRFPYSYFFFVEREAIVITACVHQRRNPQVWRNRR